MIFIDETGANTKMARLRGRAPKGQRCRAAIPHGHWKTTTFTAGLRLGGIAAPMLLDGAMDGAAFLTYVEQVLVPERGARLGNFGVTKISDNESWVTVAEWMQTLPPDYADCRVCEQYGSDNSVFLAKVRSGG